MDFQWPWTADSGRRVGSGTREGRKYFYYYSTADWGCASYAAEQEEIVRATSFTKIFLLRLPEIRIHVGKCRGRA